MFYYIYVTALSIYLMLDGHKLMILSLMLGPWERVCRYLDAFDSCSRIYFNVQCVISIYSLFIGKFNTMKYLVKLILIYNCMAMLHAVAWYCHGYP